MPRWSLSRLTGDDVPTLRESINRSIEDHNLILAELEQLEQQLKGQGGYVAEMSSDLRMNGNAITGLPRRPTNDSAAISLSLLKSGRVLYSETNTFETDKAIIGVAAASPDGLATLAQTQQLLAQLTSDFDATAAPPKVDNASAIGSSNGHFAREQHTHQGVNLDDAQSIAARKSFIADILAPLLLGSIASGGDLTLKSTEHATKGNIFFGTSTYDELNNRLGLGTLTPATILDASGVDNSMALQLTRYSTDGISPLIIQRKAAGTPGTPTAVQAAYVLSNNQGQGYDGSAFAVGFRLRGITSEIWSGTAHGTYFEISTVANGATALVERVRVTEAGIGIGITPGTGLARLFMGGTPIVVGDVVLSAAWGAGATVTAVTGTDNRGTITVTTNAANTPTANPLITLTFKDGTWTTVPFAVANMNGAGSTGPLAAVACALTATTLSIRYIGTPTALSALTYTVNYIVVG